MPWLALLTNRWTWIAAAFAALGAYAAVQHIGWQATKAEYAQFRADVESEAAKAQVRNAQEVASHAQNAQEALDDLQTRHAALGARYASLRASSGSRPVSALPGAAPGPSACPGGAAESAAHVRCLTAAEWGDRELAKYAELWKLWKANAAKQP